MQEYALKYAIKKKKGREGKAGKRTQSNKKEDGVLDTPKSLNSDEKSDAREDDNISKLYFENLNRLLIARNTQSTQIVC